MKKLTIIAALLGSVYFANAQVGIGTPDPALSAELDIVSDTKGILIPRVELTSLTVYGPIAGNPTQSLLVYNKTAVIADKGGKVDYAIDLPVGFYYWENSQWNRIVNRTELNEVINTVGGDIENIQNVINFILPSNPDNDDTTKQEHTTIVFDNTKNEFYEVTYDGDKYVRNEINMTEVIGGFETTTVMVPVIDATTSKITGYAYFNETAVKAFLAKDENNTIEMITSETDGGVVLDVKGDVVNNIKEILESKTEIIVDGITFETVEEYLQYITQFSNGNVIYTEITVGQDDKGDDVKKWVFQYWDEAKEEYVTINLDELVKGSETETNLGRSVVVADGTLPAYEKVEAPVAADVTAGEIFYQYLNEKGDDEYINMTEDIITAINNNTKVKKAITKFLSEGGNVYYGDHDDNPTSPDVFYTIDKDNNKVEIILSDSFILNLIERNIQRIKNMLGDKINNTTIINTGDQIDGEWVFKYLGETTVGGAVDGAPSAVTSGITLPAKSNATGVVSVTLLQGKNIVANNVTQVSVYAENKISFNLGTGNHFTALPAGTYKVIIEFTSSNVPPMIIGPMPNPVQP